MPISGIHSSSPISPEPQGNPNQAIQRVINDLKELKGSYAANPKEPKLPPEPSDPFKHEQWKTFCDTVRRSYEMELINCPLGCDLAAKNTKDDAQHLSPTLEKQVNDVLDQLPEWHHDGNPEAVEQISNLINALQGR